MPNTDTNPNLPAAQTFDLVPPSTWLASRDAAIDSLNGIVAVKNRDAYDDATAVIAAAKKLRRGLETDRKAVTSRLDAAKKALITRERELAGDLDSAIERVSRLAADYAAEEMRKRQEEERRIEEERRRAAEAALAAQEAAEAAATSGDNPSDADPFGIGAPPVRVPEAVEAVEIVAVPATKRPSGVKMNLCVQLVDESQLPREFLSFDEKKALAWAKYQKSLGARVADLRVAGLRFFEEATIISR